MRSIISIEIMFLKALWKIVQHYSNGKYCYVYYQVLTNSTPGVVTQEERPPYRTLFPHSGLALGVCLDGWDHAGQARLLRNLWSDWGDKNQSGNCVVVVERISGPFFLQNFTAVVRRGFTWEEALELGCHSHENQNYLCTLIINQWVTVCDKGHTNTFWLGRWETCSGTKFPPSRTRGRKCKEQCWWDPEEWAMQAWSVWERHWRDSAQA